MTTLERPPGRPLKSHHAPDELQRYVQRPAPRLPRRQGERATDRRLTYGFQQLIGGDRKPGVRDGYAARIEEREETKHSVTAGKQLPAEAECSACERATRAAAAANEE